MSAPGLVARCPAKINLALRVLRRREDGYHELDTIFQAIDLWDTLEVRPARDLSMKCDDPDLPTEQLQQYYAELKEIHTMLAARDAERRMRVSSSFAKNKRH